MQKYSLDISMGEKRLFTYNYLDDARTQINGSSYKLYFVLLGDKYKITEYSFDKEWLCVSILNLCTNKTEIAGINAIGLWGVSEKEYLNVKIADNGNKLHVNYTKAGIEYLKKNLIEEYYKLLLQCNEPSKFFYEILSKDLVDMCWAGSNIASTSRYKVLYIGQSQQETIFNRLICHETIQRIQRDVSKNYPDKELYLMLSNVVCKEYINEDIEENKVCLSFSNTLTSNSLINDKIRIGHAVNLAEAILLNHFKPEYNKNLVNINSNQKTYARFVNGDIKTCSFSLDLYWEDCNNKMILYTNEIETKTRARGIKHRECKIKCVSYR